MKKDNPPLKKCPACGSRKYVISIFGRICPDCFYEEKNDTSVSDCCGSTIDWDDSVPYCNHCKKFCQIKQLHDQSIAKLKVKEPKCKFCWDKGYASVLKNGNYIAGDFEGDKSVQLGMREIKNYGDITKIIASELPDFDLICGGFPCQSFSIAGKRGGFKDTRGTLFFDVARIIKEKRPAYLLLENVKGLINHDKGNTFATIVATIDELGYDCQWCVLNSKDFGVPQNRERVFIVGHIRGERQPKVFSFREISELADKTRIRKKNEVSRTITKRYAKDGKECLLEITKNESQGFRVYDPQGIATTLASQAGGLGAKTGLYAFPTNTKKGYAEANEGDGINLSFPNSTTRRGRVIKNNSPTLQASMNGSIATIQNKKIRRLTPKECERLMSWRDDWTRWGINDKGKKIEMSDNQRYKMCGNGVVSKVVKEIVKNINLK